MKSSAVILDGGDLETLVQNIAEKVIKAVQPSKQYVNVRGYDAIAQLLGVSKRRVWQWKAEGKLNGCYYQDSKTIIFFAEIIQERMRKGML